MSFRPPILLRLLLAAWGLLSACALAWEVARLARTRDARFVAGIGVMLLPVGIAAAALRCRWQVDDAGLRVGGLGGGRTYVWQTVRRVDQGRVSFNVETDTGALTPRWIARSDRERLLRAIVEKADLALLTTDLPWGVQARYVPRSSFIPASHVQRRHSSTGRP